MRHRAGCPSLGVALAVVSLVCLASAGDEPAGLVTKHLDSIGKPEARLANTLRTGKGTATLDVVSGGAGHLQGTSMVASMGKQFNFLMYFNAGSYNGEQFKFDGQKALVADNTIDRRENLAYFMYQHDVILKEGLWGGVWNSGWPLNDLKGKNAEIKFERTKKVDGKELLEYLYRPKHSERELLIHLFFDPGTYRHVRTEYDWRTPGDLVGLSVSESFSDFRDEKGLMLPHTWAISYEPGQVSTSTMNWKVELRDVRVTTASAAVGTVPSKDKK